MKHSLEGVGLSPFLTICRQGVEDRVGGWTRWRKVDDISVKESWVIQWSRTAWFFIVCLLWAKLVFKFWSEWNVVFLEGNTEVVGVAHVSENYINTLRRTNHHPILPENFDSDKFKSKVSIFRGNDCEGKLFWQILKTDIWETILMQSAFFFCHIKKNRKYKTGILLNTFHSIPNISCICFYL